MNLSKSKVAIALSSALLIGCGSSSNNSKSDNPTPEAGLSDSQISALQAACVSEEAIQNIDNIIVAETTQEEILALMDEAIANASNCSIENYVVLTDTSTTLNAQLVYVLPTPQAEGKLTAKVKVDSADEKLSYITLFNSSNSVKTSPLDLKIGGNHDNAYGSKAPEGESIIYSRDPVSDHLTSSTLETNTWVNISLEWGNGQVAVEITDLDGELLSSDILDYQSSSTSDVITKVAFQVSDSSNKTTTDEPIAVDDLVVYGADLTTVLIDEDFSSDLSLFTSRGANIITASEIPDEGTDPDEGSDPGEGTDPDTTIDNFSSYTLGSQIDLASSNYATYNVDGSETFAVISDDIALSGNYSLMLEDASTSSKPHVSRSFTYGVTESGSVSVSVYIPEYTPTNPDQDVKSTYIYLGTNDRAYSSGRFMELVLTNSDIRYRDPNEGQKTIHSLTKDTWVDITVSWSGYDQATETYPITITIDGSEYTTFEGNNGTTPIIGDQGGAPSLIVLYAGDNSGAAKAYFDNLSLEASTSTVPDAGTDPDTPSANQYAKITDKNLDVDGNYKSDTGELRYALANPSTEGVVSFKMYYPSAETETVKLSLFDTNTSESSMLGMIRFDEGKVADHNSTNIGSFAMEQWVDVEITYTITDATTAAYTVTVDGTELATIDAKNANNVTHVSAMLSSNSGTAEHYVGIDDLSIETVNIDGGTDSFFDDFEGYGLGDIEADVNNPYHGNTFSATVVAEE